VFVPKGALKLGANPIMRRTIAGDTKKRARKSQRVQKRAALSGLLRLVLPCVKTACSRWRWRHQLHRLRILAHFGQ
jgi:hypothetical protein